MNWKKLLPQPIFNQFITANFIILLSLLISQTASAQSSVWKVEKNGRHIYLGGTIHLLTRADYPLPGEYDLAFNNAQKIIFETDIEKIKKSPSEMSDTLLSKNNKTIDQSLKPSTIRALKAYLSLRNLSIEKFKYYSPSGLYLTLMWLEMSRNGLIGVGVDEHFAKRARLQKKTTAHFETIEQHLSSLKKMAGNDSDQLLLNGLKDMQGMPSMITELKKIWRVGDREKYRESMLKPYRQYFPTAYKALLLDRNNLWMPQIEAMFKTADVELVLVGALHLIGEHGLLQRLEAKGYKIEHL